MLSRAPLKVLVIDDDAIVLEIVRERLSEAGHEVVVRDEALGTNRAVREQAPDVILLDIMMPAINGERIIELLRRDAATSRIPVILHSSKSDAELETVVADTEALGAISKAASDDEFMARFDQLVARHRATQA